MIFRRLIIKPTLSSYLSERVSAMKNKTILYRGRAYTKSSIASWEKFLALWRNYQGERRREKPLSSLEIRDFNGLMNYCDDRGFRESTRALVASLFKAAIKDACASGLAGRRLLGILNEIRAPYREGTEAKKVWLDLDEIRALATLPLVREDPLCKARDIFLVGCYTGQRFSDYQRLSLSDIVTFHFDGIERQAFRKRQQKTGEEVYIPIIYEEVIQILQRWGGKLPQISNSLLNREIKTVCRMAGLDEPVKITERVGGRERVRTVPKYELVASHTARRSFITRMYLEGRLTEMQIRSISGHRSSHAFRRYICCSTRDNLKGIFDALRDGP